MCPEMLHLEVSGLGLSHEFPGDLNRQKVLQVRLGVAMVSYCIQGFPIYDFLVHKNCVLAVFSFVYR
jgi:hypothetical protein